MAKLDISKGKGAASAIAFNDVVSTWGFGQHRSQMIGALNNLPHGTLAEQSKYLYEAAEAAKAKGDDAGYRANRAALVVIHRTELIQSNQEKNVTSIEGLTQANTDDVFSKVYARSKALAGGAAPTAYEQRSGYNSKNGVSANTHALTKSRASDNQFEAGEAVSIGLKPTAVSNGYIRANAESIGATQKNIGAAFGIVNGIVDNDKIRNFDKALARVHELREEALKGKSGTERSDIARNYDLAAVHFRLQQEIAEHNKSNSSSAYKLPPLTAMRSRAYSQELVAYNKNIDSLRSDRVSNLSAFESAMQLELTADERPAVQKIFNEIGKIADERGLTGATRVALYRQEFDKRDSGWLESDADRAEQVFDRAVKIAAERGNTGGRIFAKPPAAAKTQPAAVVGPQDEGETNFDAAFRLVLGNDSAEIQTQVKAYIDGAEGATIPEKMAFISRGIAGLDAAEMTADERKAARRDLRLALGVLHLENKMDKAGNTNFKNARSEEFFNQAQQAADGYAAKQAAGEDISKEAGAAPVKSGRYTSEERKTIVERSAGRYAEIDPEIQLKLEKLGLSTGQRAGTDLTSAADLDGLLGAKTKASIEKLLGREISVPMDDETLKALNEKLDADLAKGGQSAGESAPAPEAQAKSTTVLRARFDKEISAVAEQNSTPTNFYADAKVQEGIKEETGSNIDPKAIEADITGIVSGKVNAGIKKGVVDKLKADGITLSAADIEGITVNKGIVYSPILAKIETALGLSVVDGKMDANLAAIMAIPAVKEAISTAFKDGKLDQLAEVAPQSLPGGGKAPGPVKS